MRPESRRRQLAWALYDWANSAFAVTVIAGFFPVFFKEYWSAGTPAHVSTFYLGVGNSLASLLIVLLAPLLGALADRQSRHKRYLLSFALPGMLVTAVFLWVPQGQWWLAIAVYVVAILGFSGANVFYDAMLPRLATPAEQHRLSALGYALGYLGGGLLFLVNVAMTLKPAWFGLPDAATAVRLSFLGVSIWWFVFTIPLMRHVPESRDDAARIRSAGTVFAELRATVARIRRFRALAIFLLAYWLYIDGVATIVRMAIDYGLSIGLPSSSLIGALLMVQFIGFPSTLLFGRLAERIGARRGLWIGLWAYVIATALAAFMTSALHFYLLAAVLGLVQGGVQSLSRSLFSQLIPPERSGEYFGFMNLLGKAAAVVGPLLIGVVSGLTGNPRIGLVSILVLFFSGMWLLSRVDEHAREPAGTD